MGKHKSAPPGKVTVQPGNSYIEFGPFGPQFQQYHENVWAAIATAWQNTPKERQFGSPSLDWVLKRWGRSDFWLGQLMSLQYHFGQLPESQLPKFWETFRRAFVPNLRPSQEIMTDRAMVYLGIMLSNVVVNVRVTEQFRPLRWRLNGFCHGPFTGTEVQYLVQHHPSIIEVGCGSGYLGAVLTLKGLDYLGVDTEKYGLGVFPWTAVLENAGRFVVGEGAKVVPKYSDRSLLLSWPEPGAAYPAET